MNQSFIAKTLAGLEPVLAEELKKLGAQNVQTIKRGASFEGDKTLMYRALYELRTALRILLPVHSFIARDERDLYEGIRDINWTKYMGLKDSFAIDPVVRSESFRHSQYVALLTKDAIVDQFREKFNRRPNVNTAAPDLKINIHVQDRQVNVSLDASGESLHMRNYRKDSVEAPLNEVLAAGMLLLSGWNGKGSFIDPMCGSGTLPIEAAMIAMNIPPQKNRVNFGFHKWPDYDAKMWAAVKAEADSKIQPFEFDIRGSDKESRARNASSLNIMAADLDQVIKIEKYPFEKVSPKDIEPGILMMNPPYDERMRLDDAAEFYQYIGDTLKKNWSGWQAWIITANRDAIKSIGLAASKRITLVNGALDCTFQQFELYEGTRQKEKAGSE